MNIAYHIPSLSTIYAQRTIYNGFKNAFIDLGHNFYTFTADDDMEDFFNKNQIDIFITASHFYYRKFINYQILKKQREKGLVMFTKIDSWNLPINKTRFNESRCMKDDKDAINLIKNGLLGDIFFHVIEQGDERMNGFEKATGYKYNTIPLAADKIILKSEYEEKFKSDVSYIGTCLPAKRDFFSKYVFPLKKKYNLKLYGQDWTFFDRIIGWIQRGGQYCNIPYLRSIVKPKLKLEDEGKIYKSSLISINVHENYQKEFGGDCNERTFKIPFCGGFEITDDVACIRKYFNEGEEIIIAKDEKEWFEKIDYYIKNPKERLKIIEAGRKKVLAEHTYHNRVQQIIDLYYEYKRK